MGAIMNIFDNLKNSMVNVVTGIMGYTATWTPAAGGEMQTGKVLYKGPSEKEKLAGFDYDLNSITMEYKLGTFDGLQTSVDIRTQEVVTIMDIDGQNIDFYVRSVSRLYDGGMYEAYLQLKT
jgi:hypothetical protein